MTALESPIEQTTSNNVIRANGEEIVSNTMAIDSVPEQPSSGVRDQLELFKALEKRWQELYGGQTPAEVREQVHRRLMAASDTTHSLDSSNHPHPPQIPSARPGLASLLEEVGGGPRIMIERCSWGFLGCYCKEEIR